MADECTRGLPTHRTEKRLVRMAGEAAMRDCPNPERIGCPNSAAVDAVVGRHLSYPDFDNLVDHIATCAPCFEEYNRQRRHYRLRRTGAIVLGCGWPADPRPLLETWPGKTTGTSGDCCQRGTRTGAHRNPRLYKLDGPALGASATKARRGSAFDPRPTGPLHKTTNRH